ncbi:MAG TPA: hypothetical protein VFC36_02935 [Paludibacter sp.]|nr:hypothetical protein [Paludibacter sp.]
MKTTFCRIVRITKDVEAIVVLEDESSFLMEGQIYDNIVDYDNILPCFLDFEAFDELSKELQVEIVEFSNTQFQQFCTL